MARRLLEDLLENGCTRCEHTGLWGGDRSILTTVVTHAMDGEDRCVGTSPWCTAVDVAKLCTVTDIKSGGSRSPGLGVVGGRGVSSREHVESE